MSLVTLVSGGLDSSLMAILAKENKNEQFPLFIDYGQLAAESEWQACKIIHQKFNLPIPVRMDISGYGKTILSGITSTNKKLMEEAFLPGRNLMFLLMGAAYAIQCETNAVCIGLLNEKTHLFPDQTDCFLREAENMIEISMGKSISILTPLREFFKADVIALAEKKGMKDSYSCHSGNIEPCGKCISCEELEFSRTEV